MYSRGFVDLRVLKIRPQREKRKIQTNLGIQGIPFPHQPSGSFTLPLPRTRTDHLAWMIFQAPGNAQDPRRDGIVLRCKIKICWK